MPYTIRVKGYSRRRPVQDKMRALFERLGMTDTKVTVNEHDRNYTPPRRRPAEERSGARRIDARKIRDEDE